MFDEHLGELHRIGGTYAPFAALLRADGYAVEAGHALPDHGVLVMRTPRSRRPAESATSFDRDGRARRAIDGWLQAATLEVGRGRVAFSCEAALFTAQIAADGERIGLGARGAGDDARLARRVIAWLARADR